MRHRTRAVVPLAMSLIALLVMPSLGPGCTGSDLPGDQPSDGEPPATGQPAGGDLPAAAGYALTFRSADSSLRVAMPWWSEPTTIAADCAPGGAAWSADGRFLYYLTQPSAPGGSTSLMRIDPSTGDQVLIMTFSAGDEATVGAGAAAGIDAAVAAGVAAGAGAMEWELAASAPEVPRLAASPDGRHLAVRGATEVFLRVGYQPITLFDLLILAMDGTEARVVDTLKVYGTYAWGPDGRLAYGVVEPVELELPVGNGESASLSLWDPATGETGRIITGSDVFLCWPVEWPEPDRLFYHVVGIKGESPTLWGAAPISVGVIDPDHLEAGGRSVAEPSFWQEPARVLPLLSAGDRDGFRGVQSVAPDGSAVAILTGPPAPASPDQALTIAVFDPATGRLTVVGEGRSARWSPAPLTDPAGTGSGP